MKRSPRFALSRRVQVALDASFFFGGIVVDAFFLRRIDNAMLLVQHGVYLGLCGGLLAYEHLTGESQVAVTEHSQRFIGYRRWAMHFFLGALLNAFLIFYFRSSSGILADIFLLGLGLAIFINGFPIFRSRAPVARLTLFAFSVTSYLAYLFPVLASHITLWHYPVAVGGGVLAILGLVWCVWRGDRKAPLRPYAAPSLLVQVVLLILFLSGGIPPVPLSLRQLEVCTKVTRTGNNYELEYQPARRGAFWRWSSSVVRGPSGMRVFVFMRIFAPVNFSDTAILVWERDDKDLSWVSHGRDVRLTLTGGSRRGFRSYTSVVLSQPGQYRVRIFTIDGREIGRQVFRFELDTTPPAVRKKRA